MLFQISLSSMFSVVFVMTVTQIVVLLLIDGCCHLFKDYFVVGMIFDKLALIMESASNFAPLVVLQ